MTFEWTINVGTVVTSTLLTLVAAGLRKIYKVMVRFVDRIETIDQRSEDNSEITWEHTHQMTAHNWHLPQRIFDLHDRRRSR